jgi:hypothetical protein
MRTIFLNQTGHRWRNVSYGGKAQRVLVLDPEKGTCKEYALHYWEALGNFAIPFVRIKGELQQLMQWTPDERGVARYAVNSQQNRDIKWGRA